MFLCESWRCALLLSSLLLHTSLSLYIPESPLMYFNDQVRERHLYTENRRQGLFLEIAPDGSVTGSPTQTANSLLELRSVKAGETVIRGVMSSLYLCVDQEGHLRGQRLYREKDCTFRELLLPDGYTLFLSPHQGLPVSLAPKSPGQDSPRLFQFLPVKNALISGVGPEGGSEEALAPPQGATDLDSQDPFGMELGSRLDMVHSPGFLHRK
nr:fibroblast growth factor 21-like [Paramormyrops kingsleyae]